MGDMNEFSLPVRLFLKAYPWRRIDPVPWTSLNKPLKECRLALLSSAGLVLPDQQPFDENFRGGDYSFREIPDDADLSQLREFHRSESFDHAGLQQDPNLVLPIQRAHELVQQGRINHQPPALVVHGFDHGARKVNQRDRTAGGQITRG